MQSSSSDSQTQDNMDRVKIVGMQTNATPFANTSNSSTQNTLHGGTTKQILLYFFIGGLIAFIELIGFYILYKFCGVYYIFASLIVFVCASAVGIVLYRRFIFGASHLRSSFEIGLTYLINTIGIGLNTLILWFCVEFLGFEAIIAKILASFIVAFYGFYARKIFIYRKKVRNV